MAQRPNRFTIYFSDEELARLERLSAAHGVRVSVLIREVLSRFRSPHESPREPLPPALLPEDALARRGLPVAFAPPPAPPPEAPRHVLTALLTDREIAMVSEAAAREGVTVSEILRRAADSEDDRLCGARRNFGERRDRPVSIRVTSSRAHEIRATAKATGRTTAAVLLERFAAVFCQ